MLDNLMRGNLLSQINQGTAFQSKIKRATDLNTLSQIEKDYLEWNSTTSNILKTGFNSTLQNFYKSFVDIQNLGNVNLSSFENIKKILDDVIPRKIKVLNDVLSNLKDISLDNLLPIENSNEPLQAFSTFPTEVKMHPIISSEQTCEYAIITALEEDEMERIRDFIEIEGKLESNQRQLISYGHLKANPKKRIAFASQHQTGMIDAAILATELLIRFQPKFLIMPGVLGGKPGEVNIGDVIVATKVFTVDKGKLTEPGFQKEIESSTNISSHITNLIRHKRDIIRYMEDTDGSRRTKIDIHFGPIACVRQVIDKKGYFENEISTEDRKTIGLEMESYSIHRACELVNNGNTTALIIKAVMDNTIDKTDGAKLYAAYNSARVINYILEKDLI
jgi:nucleoside phosphorylase